MNNDALIQENSLNEFVTKMGLLNQILCDQLQLVIEENLHGGDLVSNGIGDVLEDARLPPELKAKLLPVFVRMQNKDIMHQQLTGIKIAFRLILRQLKVASLSFEKGDTTLPDVGALIDQLYDTYVMQAQRNVHKQALGEEAESVEEGGLDFF